MSFKSGKRRLVVRLIDISSDLLMVLDPDQEVSSMLLAERATDKEIVISREISATTAELQNSVSGFSPGFTKCSSTSDRFGSIS